MPVRPFSRTKMWLLPPTLDELIPAAHPARYVAAFVDGLQRSEWAAMEISLEGDPQGAPAYHPRALLGAWLYGFMTGVRSTRKLERACCDSLPYLWLTGWQHPDHNSLWRFYAANRKQLRQLLKRTVRVALDLGLVDLAVQAVDGTKIAANAAKDQTAKADRLAALLALTDKAIADLEAQNASGGEAPPDLPQRLQSAEALKERIAEAKQRLEQEERKVVNLTDPDAQFVKSRQGVIPGYNAQAVVSPVSQGKQTGLLITAAEVVATPVDYGQLAPMVKAAREQVGTVQTTLADAGYHNGATLEACAALSQQVVMPESTPKRVLEDPYHKDRFTYNPETDTYTCPEQKVLWFRRISSSKKTGTVRVYKGATADCRACPAFGTCVKHRSGRELKIQATDAALRTHRVWMQTEQAQELYRRRKELVEPVFGILKEQLGARQFLLRGYKNVRAEWSLLAVAANLRTLWKFTSGGLNQVCASRVRRRGWTAPATMAPVPVES